jgi:hypothetical protein
MGDISTACSTLNYLKLSRNFSCQGTTRRGRRGFEEAG